MLADAVREGWLTPPAATGFHGCRGDPDRDGGGGLMGDAANEEWP